MNGETERDFLDLFRSLSGSGKKLLISMVHFSTLLGGDFNAILATTSLPEEELRGALDDLFAQGLVRKGKLEGEDRDKHFVDDKEGLRYALSKSVKADTLEKVLRMSADKDNSLF